jgi:hypothetical protein
MAKKRPRHEGGVPPPKCKAILLCERSIIEAGTEQISLIGLIDDMVVDSFPGVTGEFKLFLSLINGSAGHPYQVSIEIQDLRSGATVARSTGPMLQWEDRLAKYNVFIAVDAMDVAHEGSYEIIVFADQQEVDRQRFRVTAREIPESEET